MGVGGGASVMCPTHVRKHLLEGGDTSGSLRSGRDWGRFFFFLSFLLADFLWSSWDETPKVGLLAFSPVASLDQHCVPRFASFLNALLVSQTNKNLTFNLPQYVKEPPTQYFFSGFSTAGNIFTLGKRLERQ